MLVLLFSCEIVLSSPNETVIHQYEPQILTAKEKQQLNEFKKLRLGVGTSFPPFQFTTKDQNKFQFKGIVSDIVLLMEKRLGIPLEIIFDISFEQALALGRKREIDIFPSISNTEKRRQFLSFTKPYISYPLVIIGRKDSPFIGSINGLRDKKVAVIKHLANYSKLSNEYANLNIDYQFENNVKSVLTAVSLNKADFAISNLAVASHLINKLGLNNLQVVAPTPWDNNKLSMGVRSDKPILFNIIQKTLESITEQELQEITHKWISLNYDPVFDPWTVRYVFLPIMIFVTILLMLFFLWNHRLKIEINLRKEVEDKLAHAASHDKLTQLPNRSLFIDRLKQKLKKNKRSQEEFSILFVDLNKFKTINDTYGHHLGDIVLQKVSKRLKSCLRESDIVARFGGDEFVILLDNTKGESTVKSITNKLLLSLSEKISVDKIYFTIGASIGVAFYPHHGDNVDTLIIRADKAMYQAKKDPELNYFIYTN